MTPTEENEEYKDAIEECALGLNVADDEATEVKTSTEEGATATGAAAEVPEAAASKGQGKGKGGYGKSQNRPEAWPIPLKVAKNAQK